MLSTNRLRVFEVVPNPDAGAAEGFQEDHMETLFERLVFLETLSDTGEIVFSIGPKSGELVTLSRDELEDLWTAIGVHIQHPLNSTIMMAMRLSDVVSWHAAAVANLQRMVDELLGGHAWNWLQPGPDAGEGGTEDLQELELGPDAGAGGGEGLQELELGQGAGEGGAEMDGKNSHPGMKKPNEQDE